MNGEPQLWCATTVDEDDGISYVSGNWKFCADAFCRKGESMLNFEFDGSLQIHNNFDGADIQLSDYPNHIQLFLRHPNPTFWGQIPDLWVTAVKLLISNT